jgi:hypothetical protein
VKRFPLRSLSDLRGCGNSFGQNRQRRDAEGAENTEKTNWANSSMNWLNIQTDPLPKTAAFLETGA